MFGVHRQRLLGHRVRELGTAVCRGREARITRFRRAITDVERSRALTLRTLELCDEPDKNLIRDVDERRADLREEQAKLDAELKAAENDEESVPNADLLDELPTGT